MVAINRLIVLQSNCLVMADPGAAAMFGPIVKAVGGHIVSHACNTRIMMKKGKGEQRIVKLIDSATMPEAECVIQLTDKGIEDVE